MVPNSSSKRTSCRRLGLLAALVAALAAGCAQPPKSTYSERVILLPNRDGRSSSVIVHRASGDHTLSRPYESVETTREGERLIEHTEADVAQRYGAVLKAQPARPFTYLLFFNTASTELTVDSKISLNQVREKIRGFPAAQVTVIGHTDRVGSEEANDQLSLRRAVSIRDMLVQLGIPPSAIEIVGRGEREPLVPTPDNRPEERNRRVEIKLR